MEGKFRRLQEDCFGRIEEGCFRKDVLEGCFARIQEGCFVRFRKDVL